MNPFISFVPQLRYEDYWPVDIDKLRPNKSYDRMIEIRRERMKVYLDEKGQLRPELVESRNCPVCNAGACEEMFKKEGFTFVRCKECGIIYVNPCLRDEQVSQVYQHQSYSDITKSLMEPSNLYRRERFGMERVGIINRFIPDLGRPRRLLDVGCATGFFLEAAQAQGWHAYGIEANPFQAGFAKKNGLNVQEGIVEELDLPLAFFDAITMFEVIEHVKYPMLALQKAFEALKPGGMLFLYTPNYDCAERLLLGIDSHFIWGSNHLQYFTPATLGSTLQRTGYCIVHWETQGLDVEDMLWSYQHTGQYDTRFLETFKHQLQFLFNAGGWGKNLRMFARKPG